MDWIPLVGMPSLFVKNDCGRKSRDPCWQGPCIFVRGSSSLLSTFKDLLLYESEQALDGFAACGFVSNLKSPRAVSLVSMKKRIPKAKNQTNMDPIQTVTWCCCSFKQHQQQWFESLNDFNCMNLTMLVTLWFDFPNFAL